MNQIICPVIELNDEVFAFVNKFNTDEEFLRSGGLPTKMLDRLAFGFSEEDMKTIDPKDLNIKWKDDMVNVKWEQKQSGLSKKQWAEKINLSEPIDVIFEKNKFYIDDGHHRSYAALILNKPLNINLTIKTNPITKITPSLSYDQFHRCLFQQVKNMKLQEQLNKIKSIMGLKPINEYVTQDEVYLRDYFNMTVEQKKNGLPYDYYWFFKDFLIEYDIDFKLPTHAFIGGDGEEEPGDEYEDQEIIDWLAQNNKPLFDKFADYLYDRIEDHELNIPEAEYPAWSYFGKSNLIKPQWLIHFTNDPWPIAKNGFTRGVSEIEKLALTTHLGEFDKKYGGYNFAYRAEIYHRYAKGRQGYKYGEEAVMFIGSGMEMYHAGDEEPQVIFWGKNAKNIVPITKEFDDYVVHNLKSGGIIYKNTDLDEVVSWVMRNYQQYQNIINYEPNRKK
jgi:hypothetical protein